MDDQANAGASPAPARGLDEAPSRSGSAVDPQAHASEARIEAFRAEQLHEFVEEPLRRVIRGKDETLRLALIALIAGGHLLLEDVPGTGKTTLAKALAAISQLGFSRIQMTSDLLPQDLTGARYPSLDRGGPNGGAAPVFEFVPGPIFSEIVLADELNRTPPRTQSALLEAMAEEAVTVEGERHTLPHPFFVIATQNPIEFRGTFPLPESQLDRFMMRLAPGYPRRAAERDLIRDRRRSDPLDAIGAGGGQHPAEAARHVLLAAMKSVDDVTCTEPVEEYLLDVIEATRQSGSGFAMGASPRATLDLDRAARTRALLDGRTFTIPDDIRALAVPVLAHRLVPEEQGYDGQVTSTTLMAELVAGLTAPTLSHDGQLMQ